MKLNLSRPLAFLDLETTGINVASDRIIEINQSAVNIARYAGNNKYNYFIAGSIGPTGKLLKPVSAYRLPWYVPFDLGN